MRKSIHHKEICENYLNEVLKVKSPNENERKLRVDYAIIENNKMICIEADAVTELVSISDAHIISHLVTLVLQNHDRMKHNDIKITEIRWLIRDSHKEKFETKARGIERELKKLIRYELFPEQKFVGRSKDDIELATRQR